MFDAFGQLCVEPERLPRQARIGVLRLLAGELQAARGPGQQWLGRALATWLRTGGDLDVVLGVRAERGCVVTPQALVRRDAQDAALAGLAVATGSAAAAVHVLAGVIVCPARAAEALAAARALGCPTSRRSLARALARHRRWRGTL